MTTPKTESPKRTNYSSFISPVLQGLTGATLFGESTLHSSKSQMLKQALLGQAQKNIGFAGALYYGSKFAKDGKAKDAGMTAGYSIFAAHGYSRMFEAQQHHQKQTPRFGAIAAAMKGLFTQNPGYGFDLHANIKEMGKHIDPKAVIRSQRVGALILGGTAMYDAYKKRNQKY